jgi:hypothetical protein
VYCYNHCYSNAVKEFWDFGIIFYDCVFRDFDFSGVLTGISLVGYIHKLVASEVLVLAEP